jgi:hypothetical protein
MLDRSDRPRDVSAMRRYLRPLAALILVGLVVLALWVGRWRYFQYSGDLVRVNRFSGNAFRLTHDGWERMGDPGLADVEPMRPAPAIMDTSIRMGTDTSLPNTGAYSDSAYNEAFKRMRKSSGR